MIVPQNQHERAEIRADPAQVQRQELLPGLIKLGVAEPGFDELEANQSDRKRHRRRARRPFDPRGAPPPVDTQRPEGADEERQHM